MEKMNCWEFNKCGRELGGANAYELGVCPAATDITFDRIHGGTNAGRSCWVIAGTMCNGQVHGTFAQKHKNCGKCDFCNKVREEEGADLKTTIDLLSMCEHEGCEYGKE